jgi:arabinan endo-1,5-alpha-L-arabinosidase
MAKSNFGHRFAALPSLCISGRLLTCFWIISFVCGCSGSTSSGVGNGGSPAAGATTNVSGTMASGGAGVVSGNASTAGRVSNGGSPSSNGGRATGGGSATAGNKATSGNSGVGGQSASGGTQATGATAGSGGDRCDVGVYNASSPPVSYTIAGGQSVHDPTVILVDGVYYSANSGVSLWTRNSTDLKSWTNIKQALGGTNPSWIKTYVPNFDQAGDLWAPDLSYFGEKYHLYYAASTFGSKTSCLGHATRAAMNSGSWTDSGAPLICSNSTAFGSYTNVNWNTIDPAVILDESGNPWLVFGSGWDGIHIVRLTSTGAIDSTSTITNIARRSGANVLENSYMVRRCGFYYLLMSWDKCCSGASSTYNIRVGRSTSMTEGFVDKDGVALLSGGGTKLMGDGNGWVGPGAPVVVFNGTRAYLVYHAYDATKTGNVFAMHVSDLYWDDSGWPVTTASP